MIVLQTEGSIKRFFDRVPGDQVMVTFGTPQMSEEANRENRRWSLGDEAKEEFLRVDGVRYDYFVNAGRVARLRGMLSGDSVTLSAYANYGTAVVVINRS